MKPRGYIGLGIACAVLAVIVLLIAHSNDGLQDAVAQAQISSGQTPDGNSDAMANIIGLLLFAVAGVLVLVGAVGAGVKSGRRD